MYALCMESIQWHFKIQLTDDVQVERHRKGHPFEELCVQSMSFCFNISIEENLNTCVYMYGKHLSQVLILENTLVGVINCVSIREFRHISFNALRVKSGVICKVVLMYL